jgi:hypothetical protein
MHQSDTFMKANVNVNVNVTPNTNLLKTTVMDTSNNSIRKNLTNTSNNVNNTSSISSNNKPSTTNNSKVIDARKPLQQTIKKK